MDSAEVDARPGEVARVGRDAGFVPAMNGIERAAFLRSLERLSMARRIEEAGEIDASISLYEVCVEEGFPDEEPYVRLWRIYDRRGQPRDALRVCEACLGLPYCVSQETRTQMRDFIMIHVTQRRGI